MKRGFISVVNLVVAALLITPAVMLAV